MTPLVVGAAALVLGLAGFLLGACWSAHRAFRGVRVVTCPETCDPAAVQVDAMRAALGAAVGRPRLRVGACSRWPESQDCSQECVRQIRSAPAGCRVDAILGWWYRGRSCALCGWSFETPDRWGFEPALLGPEGIVEWGEVPPERLAEVLATHEAICWNCRVVATFRKDHPRLVVDDRPLTRSPGR